jgi:hypothetical protein
MKMNFNHGGTEALSDCYCRFRSLRKRNQTVPPTRQNPPNQKNRTAIKFANCSVGTGLPPLRIVSDFRKGSIRNRNTVPRIKAPTPPSNIDHHDVRPPTPANVAVVLREAKQNAEEASTATKRFGRRDFVCSSAFRRQRRPNRLKAGQHAALAKFKR